MPIKIKPSLSIQLDKPKMYLVSVFSDNYVSWEFCMTILTSIFYKSDEEANDITQEIQTNGEGFCGVYIFEIAETKAATVEKLAHNEKFSIRCLLEEI